MKTALLLLDNWHMSHQLTRNKLQQAFCRMIKPHHSKHSLFLQYRQRVLVQRERSLLQMQQHLTKQRKHQQEQILTERLLTPIGLSIDLNLVSQTIDDIKQIISHTPLIHDEQFLRRLKEKEAQCFQLQEIFKERVTLQFQQLCEERHLAQDKLQRIAELECYEEYLNNLQQFLQVNPKANKKKRRGIFKLDEVHSFGAVSMVSGDQGDIPYDDKDISFNHHSFTTQLFQNQSTKPTKHTEQHSSQYEIHQLTTTVTSDIPPPAVNERREKALEACLAWDRKEWMHRIRVIRLKNILRYRAHKERLAVVLMFSKYRNKVVVMSNRQQEGEGAPLMRQQEGVPLHRQQEGAPQEKRVLRVIKKEQTVESKGKKCGKSMKENTHMKRRRENGIDADRLEEYIIEKETIEKRLVMECVMMEALMRIQQVMISREKISLYHGLKEIQKSCAGQRMNALEEQFLTMQFKWELFITKMRLALTNTSNKVYQIQKMISFAVDK